MPKIVDAEALTAAVRKLCKTHLEGTKSGALFVAWHNGKVTFNQNNLTPVQLRGIAEHLHDVADSMEEN